MQTEGKHLTISQPIECGVVGLAQPDKNVRAEIGVAVDIIREEGHQLCFASQLKNEGGVAFNVIENVRGQIDLLFFLEAQGKGFKDGGGAARAIRERCSILFPGFGEAVRASGRRQGFPQSIYWGVEAGTFAETAFFLAPAIVGVINPTLDLVFPKVLRMVQSKQSDLRNDND